MDFQSQVIKTENFPVIDGQDQLFFYDRFLEQLPETLSWLQSLENPVPVGAGENLKSLVSFENLLTKTLEITNKRGFSKPSFVAIGGGSVGDSVGFLASVFRRGSELIHIPTTWLAALDSSHGGKTALNFKTYKNQIGAFYPAKEIHISKKLLESQSAHQREAAYGEILKMAILSGGPWVKTLKTPYQLSNDSLWHLISPVIDQKMKIVQKDPYEKKKIRTLLNLGHSLGHALELTRRIPHGEAVYWGLLFSFQWSQHHDLLRKRESKEIEKFFYKTDPDFESLSESEALQGLTKDKKTDNRKEISFIAIKALGSCEVVQVSISQLLKDLKTLGWVE
jgi:3-dehydroquinate synthetase